MLFWLVQRNQCDGGRTRSEPRCDFLYTWAPVLLCCWRLQWGHSDCSTAHVVSPTLARPVLPHLAIRMCRPVADNLSLNLLSSRFWTSVSVSLSLMTCNCGHLDPDLVAHRIAGHQSWEPIFQHCLSSQGPRTMTCKVVWPNVQSSMNIFLAGSWHAKYKDFKCNWFVEFEDGQH